MTDPRIEAAAKELKRLFSESDAATESMWVACAETVLAAADAVAWREIATAPRDKEIILFYPKVLGANAGIYKGRWDCDQYRKIPKPYWGGGYADLWGIIHAKKNPPTHWQPLPTLPDDEVQA